MMVNGNITGAIRLLDKENQNGILEINDETRRLLLDKHPTSEGLIKDELLLEGPHKYIHPVIFEEITPDLIRSIAHKLKRSAGPSMLDSSEWKRMLCSRSFGKEGRNLCLSIANVSKQLASSKLADPDSITALMACRLIPLDKDPGVRPIGIGKVLQRITAKSVTQILREDLRGAAGGLRLCVGNPSGVEACIHAMKDIFDDPNTDGIIQVDAQNAFNRINRSVLINNMFVMCPEIATFLQNYYIRPARLFVSGGMEISSSEGTTQGDPLAMPAYAIGILPLLTIVVLLHADEEALLYLLQVAFADDLTGGGKLRALRMWWDQIVLMGPYIGYFAEPSKSWLIVKEELLEEAERIFEGSGLNITTEGRKELGAIIGTPAFKKKFMKEKVDGWTKELQLLLEIALTGPI